MTFNYMKKTIFTLCVIVFSMLMVKAVYASEAKISVSTESVVEGANVTVTVTVTSDGNIGVGDLWLTYDASVISYYSGADSTGDTGSIRLMIEGDGTVKEVKRQIVFVGKKAGTTEIKVQSGCEMYDYDTEELMTVSSVAGKVTVTTPVVASDDNTLKKLVVYGVDKNGDSHKLTLSPSFSKNKTEYKLEVGADITKLSVTATTNDSKATVKTSGLKLSEGDNVTTIKVTAENGDSKTYYIYTEKEESKEEETTKPPKEEETTKPVVDDTEYIELVIGEAIKYMPVKLGKTVLPEGFEKCEYSYGDKVVEGARGLSKDILIFYILDENKENGKFYIYNETTKLFYVMINVQTGGKMYTLVTPPAELEIPEGFAESTVTIEGEETLAWTYGEVSDFVYVYAMNWDGQSAIYSYDTVEKTMQRVSEYAGSSDLVSKVESLENEIKNHLSTIESQKNTIEEFNKFKKNVIIGAVIIFILLLGMLIWNLITKIAARMDKKDEEAATEENAKKDVNTAELETAVEVPVAAVIDNKEESVEETAVEETCVEETHIEATYVEETHVEEPLVEKTAIEETPEIPENVVITPENSIEKEKMIPATEAEPGFKYDAEETVDRNKMVPDDSEFVEKEEMMAEGMEENVIISRLADEEIESLTLDIEPLDIDATEAIIDSLLNFELDED